MANATNIHLFFPTIEPYCTLFGLYKMHDARMVLLTSLLTRIVSYSSLLGSKRRKHFGREEEDDPIVSYCLSTTGGGTTSKVEEPRIKSPESILSLSYLFKWALLYARMTSPCCLFL